MNIGESIGQAIKSRGKERRFDDKAKAKFVKVLSETYNLGKACRACGFARWTVYNHRKKDPDFATAWADAIETVYDALEESLYERAMKGDTVSAIFILKGGRPAKYVERRSLEVMGRDGGPIHYTALAQSLRDELSCRISSLAAVAATRAIPGELEPRATTGNEAPLVVLGPSKSTPTAR